MSYGQFAKTYEKLMDKSLYALWADYVQSIAKPKDTILELACGSGDLAVLLSKQYHLILSDLSEDMLVLAHEKLPNIPIYQMDMCDITLDNSVDIIICFADSLCYLPDEKSVQKAFSQAYRLLNPGGYYLFDVHSIYQIQKLFKDYNYHYCDDTTVFVWQSYEGEFPYSVEHELTCCQDNGQGLYERYDELHCQRTYPLEHYLQWLISVGFLVEVTADFGRAKIKDTTTRWFFKAKKI